MKLISLLFLITITVSACTTHLPPIHTMRNVWVPGHYNRFCVWVPGHYMPRAVWIKAHCNRFGHWVDGSWQ